MLDCSPINNSNHPDHITKQLLQIALVLASQFVLSTVGHISDQTFDDMTPIAEITPNFDTRLTWVLRDFALEFKTLTPNSYLAQCLDQQKATSAES